MFLVFLFGTMVDVSSVSKVFCQNVRLHGQALKHVKVACTPSFANMVRLQAMASTEVVMVSIKAFTEAVTEAHAAKTFDSLMSVLEMLRALKQCGVEELTQKGVNVCHTTVSDGEALHIPAAFAVAENNVSGPLITGIHLSFFAPTCAEQLNHLCTILAAEGTDEMKAQGEKLKEIVQQATSN